MSSPDRRGHWPSLNPKAQSILHTIERFWRKSYVGDYLGLMVVITALIMLKSTDEPFHRMFRLDDPRIQFPHAEVERVSLLQLMLYSAVAPLTIIVVWTMIIARDLHKAHVTILGLAITILLTTLLTDIFKDVVGRPRPDLIARCKPLPSTPTNILVTIDVCTETRHHLLHDGWRSFPSGHSSFSFAGFGWLGLFFASQFSVLRARANLVAVLVTLAPLVCAALIAASRLEDYRHDVFDVVVGSLLGFLVALFNWHRYYPNLRSKDCAEPFRPVESGMSSPNLGFRRIRDEELGERSD